MAIMQKAYAGLVADQQTSVRLSRLAEGAINPGRVVTLGSSDNRIVQGGAGTILGISLADRSLYPEQNGVYIDGNTAGYISHPAIIWCTAQAAVSAGDAAAYDPATGELNLLVYWDAINGNDLNNGALPDPIQTCSRAIELLKANISNYIILKSDVVWDQFLQVDNSFKLQITGNPADHFAVEFTDAFNHGSHKAGIQVENYCTLIFLYAKIKITGSRVGPVFEALIGKIKARSFDCEFETDLGASGFLFGNVYAGELTVYFQGATLINMAGHLFEGVSAGADPNDRNLVYCNLTSG